MKEITMVTTCEITAVAVVTDEDAAFVENNEFIKESLCAELKKDTGADDVKIKTNQIFIRDLPNN